MGIFSLIPAWGWFDLVFTLMVLVGVWGESESAEKFLIRERLNDLMPVERKRKWLRKWSERVLIIGVAGELVCLPISLLESAELNREAGDARRLAGEANERAATNEVARARLEKEVQLLRKENLELFARIQPRRISAEQKAVIMRELRLIPNEEQCRVLIEFENSDGEARIFAKQIKDVLTEVGFPVTLDTPGITFLSGDAPARFGLHFFAQNPVSTCFLGVFKTFARHGLNPALHPPEYDRTKLDLVIRVDARPLE